MDCLCHYVAEISKMLNFFHVLTWYLFNRLLFFISDLILHCLFDGSSYFPCLLQLISRFVCFPHLGTEMMMKRCMATFIDVEGLVSEGIHSIEIRHRVSVSATSGEGADLYWPCRRKSFSCVLIVIMSSSILLMASETAAAFSSANL